MSQTSKQTRSEYQNAGLMRRLGALCYDLALLFSILMVATAVAMLAKGGESPSNQTLRVLLIVVIAAFFGGFWRNGGQTLGMRAWRLTLFSNHGGTLSWRQVAIRLSVGFCSVLVVGAGFWWALIDRERRTWHDIASDSVLRHLPPRK